MTDYWTTQKCPDCGMRFCPGDGGPLCDCQETFEKEESETEEKGD